MPANKIIVSLRSLLLALAVSGCSPSETEPKARDHARLELEEKSGREMEKANHAITEMNQKLGHKPPAIDLDVPPAPPVRSAIKP
jgi:hypothetical protein